MRNKSAAECIAFRYGQDIADVKEMAYQPGRYSCSLYTLFDGYVCCPAKGKKPPMDREHPDRWPWTPDGEAYGRIVYFAKA